MYYSKKIFFFAILLSSTLGEAQVKSQVPDLTLPDVIAKVDRKNSTYNLGPTGLRGYIHVSRRPGDGPYGTMTGESRQILVTTATAPADQELHVDDVILGVSWGRSTLSISPFASDARKAFGHAITEAEKKENGGLLRIKRWRAGNTKDVSIKLPIMGSYKASAPFQCEKSAAILANARKHFVGKLLANREFLRRGNAWASPMHALALLSSVRPEDDHYADVQAAIQEFARSISQPAFSADDGCMWTIGQQGIFLAEYYLATEDAQVLPGLNAYIQKLARSMSIFGTCNHRPALPRNDGTRRTSVRGYGAVNNAAIPANLAMVMLRKALLAGKQPISNEVETAIQRGANFFAWYTNKGAIPYGEHHPYLEGHSSNGKNACAAVLFSQLNGREKETEYFTRAAVASYNSREYGHTGQGLSYQWEGMGTHVGGPAATAAYFQPVRWHLDLSRRSDGSFAYDGQEQYGGGKTADGTYLGKSDYYDLEATAIYLLSFSLPYNRLYLTGKQANPAHLLSKEKIASAIAAAEHKSLRGTFSVAKLLQHLSDFDPVVRKSAATEIAARQLSSSELETLRSLLTSTDANARRSACEALSKRKDEPSIPAISRMLDASNEPDSWVRAAAAAALREYGPIAKSEVPKMLSAFTKNAQDPDAIDWSQPTQASNAELSFSLFNSMPGARAFNFKDDTSKADKALLIPAVKTSIQHPDSAVRGTAAQFVFNAISKEDLLMMPKELIDLALNDTQCDRMWSDEARENGIRTLAKHKFFELLAVGAKMSACTQEFWHMDTSKAAFSELVKYGDAARWTLPTLRAALPTWDGRTKEQDLLREAIASIEAATSAPTLEYLYATATAQVASTTVGTALPITLTGKSPRQTELTYILRSQPAHGTLNGTAPNLTYTPSAGYTGPDHFSFQVKDSLTTSEPATFGIIVGTGGQGLKGEYFSDKTFQTKKLTRIDPSINFDATNKWPDDTAAVKWTGYILIPETANYTFSALSQGAILQIDNQKVIDNLSEQPLKWADSKTLPLKKGMKLLFEMAYFTNESAPTAKLKWSGPSIAGITGDFIPAAYLYAVSPIEP